MFASRLDYRLPSFSELVLSIHPTYPQTYCNAAYGLMPMRLREEPYYQLHGRSKNSVPVSEYDSMSSSPSSPGSKSPLVNVHPLELSASVAVGGHVSPVPNSVSSASTPVLVENPITTISAPSILPKRKHVCLVCSRSFTTSGHLARHNRTHTGERKHLCPHPTCSARFARQDNCMQHYKTHLNGRGRRRARVTADSSRSDPNTV